jgi:hypothetical protein
MRASNERLRSETDSGITFSFLILIKKHGGQAELKRYKD